MVGGVWKQFQMTNLSMPNNFSFMKYAEKSVPGLDDVGVPHGDGDGPRTPHRCPEGSIKFFKCLIQCSLDIATDLRHQG